MATGGASEVKGKISENALQCSICSNRFNEPKFLDCLHTFCFHCLQNLRQVQDPQGMKLKCPLCRRETILGRNGVEDLPTNLTLSALVEEFTIQEQLREGQGSEIKCQSCDEDNPAISFCMECPHFLCQNCESKHECLPATKFHKTYTMAQLKAGEVSYKSRVRKELKCGKHPDQNLNIYCKSCQQLMCITCSVLEHEKHSHADMSEVFGQCKEAIEELIGKVEKKKIALSNANKNTGKSRNKLDSMFETTNTKISQKADKEIARIREMEQKLKEEAKEIYEDKIKILETTEDANDAELTVAEHTTDKMNQLLAHEIKTEIIDLKPKLVHNFSELTEKKPENVPDKLHFIDFHEGDGKTLGRIVLEDRWRLKKTINHRVDSVASFSDHGIVKVTGNQLVYYTPTHLPNNSPQSPFFVRELQIPDLRHPHQVAVNRLDQLIILDGPVVKTFSREYQLLHHFQPGLDSNSKPTCLAVDDNNQIAVGYQAKQEISLHKPDGSLLRTLPAPMIADQLVISSERFIYVNCNEKKMVSKNYNTDSEVMVDISSPRSVCCDSQGNIYVANDIKQSRLNYTTDIRVFSPQDKYIGRIIQHCTPHPQCMAFTAEGDLMVGGSDSLQIYQRV